MTDKVLVLHHWDTDGICSCIILTEELRAQGKDPRITCTSPRLGNYFLDPKDLDRIKNGGYSEIYIVDMAIPGEQVATLAEGVEHLWHFDHHLQEPHNGKNITHINPVAHGKTQKDYPACTYVLKEHFDRDLDLPTILGVTGDLENRIFKYPKVMPGFEAYLVSRGLSFFDVMRMCEHIDSSYKIDDQQGVKDAVGFVAAAGEDPGPILSNNDWIIRSKTVQYEIDFWLKTDFKIVNECHMYRIKTRFHVISSIGRKAFRTMGGTAVILNTGFDHMDQIYARGGDMSEAISLSRGLGMRAGGKKDVVGVILPKGKLEDFLPRFMEKVCKV